MIWFDKITNNRIGKENNQRSEYVRIEKIEIFFHNVYLYGCKYCYTYCSDISAAANTKLDM